jgi:hypothetical protein
VGDAGLRAAIVGLARKMAGLAFYRLKQARPDSANYSGKFREVEASREQMQG